MTYLVKYCFLLKCHCSLQINQCQTCTRRLHSSPRQMALKLNLRCQRSFVAKLAQASYSIQKCQAYRRADIVVDNLQSPVERKKTEYNYSISIITIMIFYCYQQPGSNIQLAYIIKYNQYLGLITFQLVSRARFQNTRPPHLDVIEYP